METVRLKTALIAAVLLTHCGSISAAAADDNGYGADDYGTQGLPAPAPPVAQAPPSAAPPPSPGPVPQAAAPTPKPPAPPPPAAAPQASAPPPPGPPSSAPTPQPPAPSPPAPSPPAPSPPAPTPNGHDHRHLITTTPVAGPQLAATPAVVPTPQPSAPPATPPPPAPSPPVPLAKAAPAPSWSPPTWNVPQIASDLPTPQVPQDFHYVVQTEKICAGVAYTDQSNIGCSGWQGISEVECQKKCTNNTAPSRGAGVPRCPTKTCYAAAVFSTSGWCHLFEAAQCRAQTDEPKVKLYLKTAKGGLSAIWNSPTMNKMKKGTDTGLQKFKKEMQTPVAQNALKAGAVVVAAGAVAAGVGGAIALQKQQEAEKKKQQQLRQQQPRQRMGVVPLPTVAPTLPGNASSPDQSSSYILPSYSPNLLVTSTAPPAASSSLSAPSSSSSGVPIWLSLIAIGCCCCAIAFASIALMKMGKRPRARRDESFDESEEEYEQEPAD